MELLSVFILILISILTAAYAVYKNAFNYWKSRGVPHDEPSIPYGNIKGVGKTIHFSLAMKKIYDKFKSTGEKFCGVYFHARPVAVILDLDLVKHILVKDFANFDERGLYYNEEDDALSAHLFQVDGTKWKKLRAKLTPTFTSGKMKFMFSTVVEVGDRFRDCIFEVAQKGDLEIKDLLARFTTDVIGTCAFGIECNSLKDPNAEFRHYGQAVFSKPRHSPMFMALLIGFRNTGKKLRVKLFSDDVTAFFMNVVRDTVEYREKNNITRNDFMDILIKLKNEETNEKNKAITLNELAAQAFVFFLAGFETSSTTLTFCLYELCMNPEIQSKARQIIKEAYKKHNGQFTYEMMMDMPYIDQLLEETMRKYPPVANLTRLTQNDYMVPDTEKVIEKGTTVLIPAYAIQNDPEVYPEPEKFDPERFGSEGKAARDSMAWLPFGTGPRNCIGLRFGMMQARIGLVSLLNNFEISLSSKTITPLVFESHPFILSPQGGIYLNVKPIKS